MIFPQKSTHLRHGAVGTTWPAGRWCPSGTVGPLSWSPNLESLGKPWAKPWENGDETEFVGDFFRILLIYENHSCGHGMKY